MVPSFARVEMCSDAVRSVYTVQIFISLRRVIYLLDIILLQVECYCGLNRFSDFDPRFSLMRERQSTSEFAQFILQGPCTDVRNRSLRSSQKLSHKRMAWKGSS